MDDFKRQTMDMTTSYDLVDCPVHYRSCFRRKLMDIARRRARRKLKRELRETMATSSFTKEFNFETKEEVDALFDAIERSAKQQGIDLDVEQKEHKQSNYDYIDDLNDIFPFIPRGEYRRVKDE